MGAAGLRGLAEEDVTAFLGTGVSSGVAFISGDGDSEGSGLSPGDSSGLALGEGDGSGVSDGVAAAAGLGRGDLVDLGRGDALDRAAGVGECFLVVELVVFFFFFGVGAGVGVPVKKCLILFRTSDWARAVGSAIEATPKTIAIRHSVFRLLCKNLTRPVPPAQLYSSEYRLRDSQLENSR